MTALRQVRVAWTGGPGGPGVSTHYCSGDVAVFLADLRTFYSGFGSLIPTQYTLTFPSTGVVIDDTTGQATGTWGAPAPTPIDCSGAGAYAAPVGLVFNWKSGTFTNGRELRGKTFIVPVLGTTFSADGSIADSLMAGFRTTAQALVATTAGFRVFSRTALTSAAVTSASVPDLAAVLTSRRD